MNTPPTSVRSNADVLPSPASSEASNARSPFRRRPEASPTRTKPDHFAGDAPVESPRTSDPNSPFEELLRAACRDRLGPISWFKADWQRGGAKTGRSTFVLDDGRSVPVIVKFPVGPAEFAWNHRLQPDPDAGADEPEVTARLYASDLALGQYDFAWLVMERFPEGPLFALRRDDAMDLMADVAARFHHRAARYPVEGEPKVEPWTELLERARASCRTNSGRCGERWKAHHRVMTRHLDTLVEAWANRPCRDWCHGDLHPANAMSRSKSPEDPAMLIDLAEVRPGHWVQDAVYLERLFWTRPDIIEAHPPVELIARRREQLGLSGLDEEARRLADVRRVLLAATAPAFMRTEGNPAHLAACLDVLDRRLQTLV